MSKFIETLNGLFAKLPFKGLAEKYIPAGARTKVPLLEKIVIPFANQIVVGLVVLLLITAISPSGGLNLEESTRWVFDSNHDIFLATNGAFVSTGDSQKYGYWKVSGNKLTVNYRDIFGNDIGTTEEFRIRRNSITNSNGNVFKRDTEWDKLARQPAPAQVTSGGGGGSSQQQSSSQQNQPVQIARVEVTNRNWVRVTLTTGESTEQSAEWLGSTRNHAIRRIEGDLFYVEYYDNQMRNPTIWKKYYRVRRGGGIGSSLTISEVGNWN